MSAPKNMAKRAAAGTLALAVCLSGGAIAFSGAAFAAGAPATVAVAGNAVVVPGTDTQALNTALVTLPSATYTRGSTVVLSLPNTGGSPNLYSFSGTPTVVAAPINVSGTWIVPSITTAVSSSANGTNDVLTVTFTNTPGSATAAQIKLSFAGLKVKTAAGVTSGAVSAALTGTGAYAVGTLTSTPVALGQVETATISIPAGQSVVTGSSRSLPDVTLKEAAIASFDSGSSKTFVVDVSNASAVSTTGATVTIDGTGTTPTWSLAGGSGAATLTVSGLDPLSAETIKISGLKATPTAAGPMTVSLDTSSTAYVPSAKEYAPASIAAYAAGTRIGGSDRYSTAAAVAKKVASENASISGTTGVTKTVILTNGGASDPSGVSIDALSASFLAGQTQSATASASYQTPIVLTDANALPSVTLNAIKSILGNTSGNIVILGGTGAVSQSIEDQLNGLYSGAYNVSRIAGHDRYDTAAQAALQGGAKVGSFSGLVNGGGSLKTAIVASGLSPADALSAGPVAAADNLPLLLTQMDSVPQVTLDALSAMGIQQVYLMGGSGVVSANVTAQLKAAGLSVVSFAGTDRYDTSAQFSTTVNALGSTLVGATSTNVYVASGLALSDASVAAPLVAEDHNAFVITSPTSLSATSAAAIALLPATVKTATGVGLTGALPQSTLDAAGMAANFQ